MSAGQPDAEALRRLRLIIAVVLGGLFFVSLVVAIAGLWPTQWVDELGISWFGHSTWRLRIVGTFSVFGSGLLAVLLIALVAKTLWKTLRKPPNEREIGGPLA